MLPKFNGNTPIILAAGLAGLAMVCITVLGVVGQEAPTPLRTALFLLTAALTGGSIIGGTAAFTQKSSAKVIDKVTEVEHKVEDAASKADVAAAEASAAAIAAEAARQANEERR